MTAAKEMSDDAAVEAVSSELMAFSCVKKNKKTPLEAFLAGRLFALLSTGFGKSFVNAAAHSG